MADFKEIIINSKKHGIFKVLVSAEDFLFVSSLKLSITPRGKNAFYVQDSHQRLLHRMLTKCPEGLQVDHINRNPLDNRRENLRIVTQRENIKNRNPYSNTKYKFFYFVKKRKGHNPYYDVKIPNYSRRCFGNINEAKAYYLECIMEGANVR